ncbi:RICIN domain-containing protein [Kitasatospora sp. NPDC004240]
MSTETSFITSWLTEDEIFVLSVYGASTEPGTGLCIWPSKSTDNEDQLWTYVDGLYLQNQKSGLVAEIRGSDPGNGAEIQINTRTGAANQHWAICGDGFIRSMMNGNALSVFNSQDQPGTPVVSSTAQLPIVKDPYGGQGWWQDWISNGSCQNLVTVVTNNTAYELLVQGTPSTETEMLYPASGSPAVECPPGTVVVFMSHYHHDNEVDYDLYSIHGPGPSASFNAHQHRCALESGRVWVDNINSAFGFSLTTPVCVEGDWDESLPGTILISVEGGE